jgi:hypothetical protein
MCIPGTERAEPLTSSPWPGEGDHQPLVAIAEARGQDPNDSGMPILPVDTKPRRAVSPGTG